MKIMEYILEVLICSGLFLVLYRWLLAGKVGYRICRTYIVGTMLLAAVIPALDVPLYPPVQSSPAPGPAAIINDSHLFGDKGTVYNFGESTATDITDSAAATEKGQTDKDIRTAILNIITAVYCLTATASIVLILFNIAKIRRLRRSARLTPMEDWILAESEQVETPFSFLRTVYMGFNYAPSERLMIITHEASHVRHWHSYERLVLSVLRSLLWFNPFLWMAEKDLREVQEWEADRDVLDKGNDLTLYRTAIFKQLFGYNPDISSGLNHSLTKKRFIMMTKTQLGRYAFLRLAAALPLLTATFLAFGCGNRTQTPPKNMTGSDSTVIQTAADAGTQQDSVIVIDISQDGNDVKLNGKRSSYLEVREYLAGEKSPESTIRINFNGDSHTGILSDISNAIDSTRAIEYMIIEGNDKDHKVRIKFASDTAATEITDNALKPDTVSVKVSYKDASSDIPSAKDSASTITFQITDTGNKTSVVINGREYEYDSLGDIGSVFSGIKSDNISSADITVIGDVVMGVITDVKQSLRKAGVRQISIAYKTDADATLTTTEIMRILPPALKENADSAGTATSEIPITDIRWKYIHQIMVNSNDRIMMDGYQVTLEEIPQKAVEIIEAQGIRTDDTDGDWFGSVFAISSDNTSSSELYVKIQSALDEAYDTVRDRFARKMFGKPLSGLTPEELDEIRNTIPKIIAEAEPEQIKYEEPPRH